MLDAAGAVSNYDNAAPGSRPSMRPRGLESPQLPELPSELEGLGFIVRNSDAKIDWEEGVTSRAYLLKLFTMQIRPKR
jgi:hypothetical protein